MSDETNPRVTRDFMTTKEVADYLRIKERRVYELVRRQEIPCTRVTGKWLFPRALVDLWLAEHAGGAAVVPAPPVSSARPQSDSLIAQSRSGSWLPATTGGGVGAGGGSPSR